MNSSDAPAARHGPAVSEPPLDVAHLIESYLKLRDRKAVLDAEHKERMKPFTQLMDEIGGKLLKHLQDTGANHVASPNGTAYQTTTPSATVSDRGTFRNWVVANSQFDLVDWRANAPAVFAFLKDNNGVPPPGLRTSTFTKVGVRRPNEKE